MDKTEPPRTRPNLADLSPARFAVLLEVCGMPPQTTPEEATEIIAGWSQEEHNKQCKSLMSRLASLNSRQPQKPRHSSPMKSVSRRSSAAAPATVVPDDIVAARFLHFLSTFAMAEALAQSPPEGSRKTNPAAAKKHIKRAAAAQAPVQVPAQTFVPQQVVRPTLPPRPRDELLPLIRTAMLDKKAQ